MDNKYLHTLLEEEGYPTYMIESTIMKLEKLQPEIASAFNLWLLEGITPDINAEGYTFSNLIKNYGMKPVGAFITLDWLKREPIKANAALQRGIK